MCAHNDRIRTRRPRENLKAKLFIGRGTVITLASASPPVRTCLGCRQRDSQRAMVRLIALPSGVALWSPVSESGRGGYLHPRAACLEGFERSRVKESRSLKRYLGSDERRAITELVRKRLASQAGVD